MTTYTSTIHPTFIKFLEELSNVKPNTEPLLVCSTCGSSDVYYDAYVGVNDPTDVRTFQQAFCDECEGETTLVTPNRYEKESN